ncbi:MAG TPA: ribonuclease III [Desulfomonilia bacterium]|nr:ribonuclease III [Desulfomonilia bacterium]
MEYESLESKIGYSFDNKKLLRESLTHTTYVNEHREEDLQDNQRLEFLGDAIINAVITTRLFTELAEEREGILTKKRAELINETALSRIARYLSLGEHLLLGRGEEMDQGREKASILADAYEALVGAIFLDSAFEPVSRIVERHFREALGPIEKVSITDYKSLLLEICQSRFKCLPRVVVVDEIGPEHDKEFVVDVELEGKVVGRGRGRNKKQAAQTACKEALRSLNYPLS